MEAKCAVEFLRICGRLKQLKRTGWINNQIHSPESVADHMYRMAMCCMLVDDNDNTVDKTKCLKMAIVHDLAESFVGDITPHDGVSKEEKYQLEATAMSKICATIGVNHQAQEISALWKEYETGETAEAKLVKDFDKFEMILQADEYEQDQNTHLQQFFDSTKSYFQTPLVQSWVKELHEQRNKRLA